MIWVPLFPLLVVKVIWLLSSRVRTTLYHLSKIDFYDVYLYLCQRFYAGLEVLSLLVRLTTARLVSETSFLPAYYRRSELVWLDGFLLDFLQKKSLDIWLRKFVLVTGYVFSERMVFDQVVRIYMDNLI